MDEIKMRVAGVEKSFPSVKALSNIDFSVRKGTVHALCGENGAGKSTLMKIIMGLYKADKGQLYIDEKPVEIKSPIQAREYGISMIAQELNYVPELSVEENLFLGRLPVNRLGKVNWKQVRRQTIQFLKDEGLPYSPAQKLKTLTVSDIQMLEIIKAVTNNAQIIIMDEPTSSITEKEVAQLFKKIGELKAKGVSIIYISHKMDEVFKIADDITILRDGSVVSTDRAEDLDLDTVIARMVGRKISNIYPREDVAIGEKAIEVEHFCQKGIFEDISFYARRGEIVGFAGLVLSLIHISGFGLSRRMRATAASTSPADAPVFAARTPTRFLAISGKKSRASRRASASEAGICKQRHSDRSRAPTPGGSKLCTSAIARSSSASDTPALTRICPGSAFR